MFAEVDCDGRHRRGLSREEMAALVEAHRAALVAILKAEGLAAVASELREVTSVVDLARELLTMYRVGADALGFNGPKP